MNSDNTRLRLLQFIALCLMLVVFPACRRENITPVSTALPASSTPVALGEKPADDGAEADAPVGTATPAVPPSPTPTRVPPESTATEYTVRAGDTLLRIAAAYGTTTESLMVLNGLANADQLAIGQVLKVTMEASYVGPGEVLIPDSELVYGPSYVDFDIADTVSDGTGYLAQYVETVNGREMTGPEIVELVAVQYSVGPRVLLALLELRGGWLSSSSLTPDQQAYPLGYQVGLYWEGLYLQLCQAANSLNAGFYDWWGDTSWLVQTTNGTFIQYSSDLNAGTAAVQHMLADTALDYDSWIADLSRFTQLYSELFGDPFLRAVEPLIPPYVGSPELVLPWSEGQTWYYTGGPHPGWGTRGAFAAVDFVTDEENIGCMISQRWATAVAPGVIAMSDSGMVLEDLDGDGFVGSGWVMMYMHMGPQGRVEVGDVVATGDPIGHPSCEGGVSDASHLHFARRLNGVWIAADDVRWPMVLSGWQAVAGAAAYDGTLEKDGQTLTACECWAALNAVAH